MYITSPSASVTSLTTNVTSLICGMGSSGRIGDSEIAIVMALFSVGCKTSSSALISYRDTDIRVSDFFFVTSMFT